MKRGGRHFAHCDHFQFSPLRADFKTMRNSTSKYIQDVFLVLEYSAYSILLVLYAFLSTERAEEIFISSISNNLNTN